MSEDTRKHIVKWVQDGLAIPDVDIIVQQLKESPDETPYPLYLMLQALTWLHKPGYKEDIEKYFIDGYRDRKVIQMKEWKDNHIRESIAK